MELNLALERDGCSRSQCLQSRRLHFQRRLTYKVLRDWFLKTTSIPLFGFSEKLALRNALQEEHIQRVIEAATSAAPSKRVEQS